MKIYRDVQIFQPVFKEKRTFLAGELGNRDTSNIEPLISVCLDQTENICIVSDAEIPSNLVFFDVFRADDDDNFSLIAELFQKSELTVGSKTRQHAGGVIIVKKFSSEFKVKFVVEFADSVTNVFRLHFQILFVVKTDFHIFPFQILLCIYIGWR